MFYGQERDKKAKANALREVAACLVRMLTNEPETPEDGWPRESFAEALRAAKSSVSLLQQVRDTESEAYGFTIQQLSNCHLINDDFSEAISHGNEALRVFERSGNHHCAASVYASLSKANALKGDNAEALRLAQEGIKLAKRASDQNMIQFFTELIEEYGPLVAKEQQPEPTTAPNGRAGPSGTDNCAYVNGNPFVTYDNFQPRVVKGPPEQAKEVEAASRAPKREKAEVIYTTRWVRGSGAKQEARPQAPASHGVQKAVRAMGPSKGGREVLPVCEAGLAGFEPEDFETDDAESWRRPSPTDGYQQRILASSGEAL